MPRPPTCDRCGREAAPAYRLLIGRADAPQDNPIVMTACPACVLAISRPLAARQAAQAQAQTRDNPAPPIRPRQPRASWSTPGGRAN
jgi:hypothetical protein